MLSDILAVIPARGGSKRLPQKNILPLAGKPLIAHSIAAALAVRPALRKVLVTTDDPAIAQAARDAGADVPFMRPAELSTDTAGSLDVVQHALDWVEQNEGWTPQWVLLLQPTSPLRTSQDIEAAIAIAEREGGDSVIGVTDLGHAHPLKAQRIVDGALRPYLAEAGNPMSYQGLEPAYGINGALYLTRTETIRRGSFTGDICRPYPMKPEMSVDIDHLFDLRLVEFLMAERNGPQGTGETS